ncbi:hypothetical protein RHMOL_Rhmol07G0190200 [Rhododendron molle]|uniref:Uncharacterized protein n=1 Tax=Rhododendron molle TaxID=49168 RepID=A0ACC0N223_RHOML|nr:hypothetical protein RHMOL_Rhmol07G0190200 [Rhododendron molle]
MPFYMLMIESEDILEKDNGGIQDITERERTVSYFTVVVERDEAAAACEDRDEDETCTGEARRMSELRVSGECFTVVVESDEAAAAYEDGGEEAAACEDGDEDETYEAHILIHWDCGLVKADHIHGTVTATHGGFQGFKACGDMEKGLGLDVVK